MEIILPFIYTGKFQEIRDPTFLAELLATSHSLQMEALFECCYKTICANMNCYNFLEFCHLAFQYHHEGMITHVLTLLVPHFEEVAKKQDFLKLSGCQMRKISQLPDILKAPMDTIIQGLFRWTEVDEDRQKILLQILSTLDLQRVSTTFLVKSLRERVLVKKNNHLLTLLTAEATSQTLAATSKNLENWGLTDLNPKLLAFGMNNNQQVLSLYDIKENRWLSSQILPFHLDGCMSTVWFDGHVYVFGGSSDADVTIPSAKVIKYCPASNSVASFRTLSEPVYQAGAGVVGKSIYVVNGIDENDESVSTVQRYCQLQGLVNC